MNLFRHAALVAGFALVSVPAFAEPNTTKDSGSTSGSVHGETNGTGMGATGSTTNDMPADKGDTKMKTTKTKKTKKSTTETK